MVPTATPTDTPPLAPIVFDNDQRVIRRMRAFKRCRKSGGPAFFTQRCANDAAERLQDIARVFQNALIIGPAEFWPTLANQLPHDKHPKQVHLCYDMHDDIGAQSNQPFDSFHKDDALPFEAGQYDLIISCLSLHSVNDLPGGLMNMRHILAPDGLIMASIFGGDSLCELRRSFYAVEAAQLGGMSPRIFPMVDFSQAAALLQRAGLALPVVDTDRFTVHYNTLEKLVSDLRDQGETNILTARNKKPLSANFMKNLEKNYRSQSTHRDKKLPASFEILWLTGWAPHESQQKPLKPGSAKTRLADALGTREQRL